MVDFFDFFQLGHLQIIFCFFVFSNEPRKRTGSAMLVANQALGASQAKINTLFSNSQPYDRTGLRNHQITRAIPEFA